MTIIRDPYKLLRVPFDIDEPTLKVVYRRYAKRYHPDRGGDAKKFNYVQIAYDQVLTNIRAGIRPEPPAQPTKAPLSPLPSPRSPRRPKAAWWTTQGRASAEGYGEPHGWSSTETPSGGTMAGGEGINADEQIDEIDLGGLQSPWELMATPSNLAALICLGALAAVGIYYLKPQDNRTLFGDRLPAILRQH